MKSAFIAGTALLSVLFNGYAAADEDCSDPVSDWQSRETLRQQVERQYGWSVQRIKVDDGCYKLKGLDRQGNVVEARYSPASLHLRKLEIHFRADSDGGEYLGKPLIK